MRTTVLRIAVFGGMLLAASAASAQQPARPDAHHPPSAAGAPAAPAPGMHGMMPMAMCRQMMAEMSGPNPRHEGGGMRGMDPMGMMGMMGPPADPAQAAQMMEMRGEMMKALGEIMLKHAQRMQATPPAR